METKTIKLITIALVLFCTFMGLCCQAQETFYYQDTTLSGDVSNYGETITIGENVTLSIIGSVNNFNGKIIMMGCNSKLNITGSFTGNYNGVDIERYCSECINMVNVTQTGVSNDFLSVVGNLSYVNVLCIIPLPVELIKLDCKRNKINWSTGVEINNSHFDVNYSNDGVNWIKDGMVQGNGNTNDIINYEYNTTKNGYYKVTQIDYDGVSTDFDVLYCNGNTTSLKYLISTYNMLGQEVNNNTKGLVIQLYSDGSKIKVFR